MIPFHQVKDGVTTIISLSGITYKLTIKTEVTSVSVSVSSSEIEHEFFK